MSSNCLSRNGTAKKIHFVLNIEYGYLLPNSIKVRIGSNSPRLVRDDHEPIQRSLFDPIPEDAFNDDEKEIAVHLDKQEQFILWWDRNFARRDYDLQGFATRGCITYLLRPTWDSTRSSAS